VADMVPVDTVVNAMIAAAWETSVKWWERMWGGLL
jgi:hypothetical protein